MFELTIQTLGGPVKVQAQRVGEFLALHRAPAVFGSFWDLSHVQSGRKLGRFVTKRQARAFAAEVMEAIPELLAAEPVLDPEARAAFLVLLETHGGVMIQPRSKR